MASQESAYVKGYNDALRDLRVMILDGLSLTELTAEVCGPYTVPWVRRPGAGAWCRD
jgi:hypothetical protein